MPEGLPGLLRLGRNVIEVLHSMNRDLVGMLKADSALAGRVARLMSTPGVGLMLALTWALEIGDVGRFASKGCHQLLRLVRCRAEFSRQIAENTDLEAAGTNACRPL